MRHLPLSLSCLLALPGAASAAGPRLDAGVGAAWFHAHPDEGTAPAASLQLRQRLGRIDAGLGAIHLRRGFASDATAATIAPLTFAFVLDDAPLAPRFGGGVAAIHVHGGPLDWGPVVQAGADLRLDATFSIGGQIAWIGHGRATFFPWYSALTFGLSAAL